MPDIRFPFWGKRGVGFPNDKPNGSVCRLAVAMVSTPAHVNGHFAYWSRSAGGAQASASGYADILHHFQKDRLVLSGQDDPGEERVQSQPEVRNAFLALAQTIDEPVDAILLSGVFESQLGVLSQAAQFVEAILQPLGSSFSVTQRFPPQNRSATSGSSV
ncbi:MAG: hypothetical protein EXS05_03065 [Planctomycetaceae bacterium]|nr:hypothetical protein [Planctomycetaceae bacterium]